MRDCAKKASGGVATHRERGLYTPRRAGRKAGLMGREQPYNDAVHVLEMLVVEIKRENPLCRPKNYLTWT